MTAPNSTDKANAAARDGDRIRVMAEYAGR